MLGRRVTFLLHYHEWPLVEFEAKLAGCTLSTLHKMQHRNSETAHVNHKASRLLNIVTK